MKRIAITIALSVLAGCVRTDAAPQADRPLNHGTVTGYGQMKISETYTEDYVIITDSFGHEHRLEVSDAVIGDEYTIRYGTVVEKTYEGCYDDNEDYYIVELEGGELHEVEADDLITGDEVTVYFYEDRPLRTRYGWK